jgi:hypothetical protein
MKQAPNKTNFFFSILPTLWHTRGIRDFEAKKVWVCCIKKLSLEAWLSFSPY